MRLFLGAFLNSVNAGQREAVLATLDRLRRQGQIQTDEQFKFELSKMAEILERSQGMRPSLEVPSKIQGIVTSEELNDIYRSIFLDLSGAFRHASRAATTIVEHDTFQMEALSGSRDALRKVLNDLRVFLFLKNNPEFDDVKLVDFGSGQTGRNMVSGPIGAQIDPETSVLRLRERTRQQIESRRGALTPAVTSEVLSAGIPFASKSFKPENAIDPRRDTFWAEVVLAERPVRTQYDGTDYDGTIVQLTIDLARTEFVNEIAIQPFSEFPMRVLDIEVSTDNGTTWTTVTGFQVSDFTTDWIEQRFDRVEANAFRVTVHQPSFTERVFLLPRDQVSHALIWDQVIQAHFEAHVNTDNVPGSLIGLTEQDEDAIPYVNSLESMDNALAATPRLGESDLDEFIRQMRASTAFLATIDPESQDVVFEALTGEQVEEAQVSQEFLELRKVEYVVGAFNVRIADVGFEPVSIYQSPRFRSVSDPQELSLEVDETVTEVDDPESSSTVQVTSTEYNLNLAKDRRVPIVPIGTTRVTEFVFVDERTRKGTTRFTPAGTPNATLRASVASVPAGSFSLTGKTLSVDAGYFQRSHRYVLSYDIAAGQDTVDPQTLFDSKPVRTPEIFTGTEVDGSIQLRNIPFVAMEIINGAEGPNPDWVRVDPEDAKYVLRADKAPLVIDGVSYGSATGALTGAVSATATSFSVSGGASFPAAGGTIEVENSSGRREKMTYTSFSSGTFSGVTRAVQGTPNLSFASSDTVRLASALVYQPILVTVDGIKARNVTDYLSGENPAFVAPDPRRREYSFIQAGRSIFFNDQIINKRIEVQYNTLVEYLQLQATLRCNTPVVHPVTPVISEYKIRVKRGSPV